MQKVRFRAEGTVKEGSVVEEGFLAGGTTYDADAVSILPPCEPTKVIAAGMNYQEHVESITGEDFSKPEFPPFFFKPLSAIIPHASPIIAHEHVNFLDYEGELAVVIGAECSDVSIDNALEYVAGFTCLNDVSARDWIAREFQWARGKGMDTFCPVGPYLQTRTDLPLRVETRVNGDLRQQASTSDLFFSIPELIASASASFCLHPGDIIATGTPMGTAGEEVPRKEWASNPDEKGLHPGDTVEVSISGVGTLENTVRAESG